MCTTFGGAWWGEGATRQGGADDCAVWSLWDRVQEGGDVSVGRDAESSHYDEHTVGRAAGHNLGRWSESREDLGRKLRWLNRPEAATEPVPRVPLKLQAPPCRQPGPGRQESSAMGTVRCQQCCRLVTTLPHRLCLRVSVQGCFCGPGDARVTL